MAEFQDPPDTAPTLNGWKEIGAYFGRSSRSVQRWERDFRLPVHRMQTAKGQVIYARPVELEAWRLEMERRPGGLDASVAAEPAEGTSAEADDHAALSSVDVVEQASPRPLRRRLVWMTVATLGIVALVSAVSFARRSPRPPARFVLAGGSLEARDVNGHLLWSYPFESTATRASSAFTTHAVGDLGDAVVHEDLDGDGVPDTLVPVQFMSQSQGTLRTDQLVAISDNNRLLWTVDSIPALTCGNDEFTGPWHIGDILVSSAPGPKTVWVSYYHFQSWPSVIVEIAPNGVQRMRYLQAGWIVSMEEWRTPQGSWLVAGGVFNEPAQPGIALMPLDGPPVASPSTDARYQCAGAPVGRPDRVILFPNLDAVQAQGIPYVMANRLRVMGEDLNVDIGFGESIAVVGADGIVKGVAGSDGYWLKHRKFEATHALMHTVEQCPEKIGPRPIQAWTPSEGWRKYDVPPSLTPKAIRVAPPHH